MKNHPSFFPLFLFWSIPRIFRHCRYSRLQRNKHVLQMRDGIHAVGCHCLFALIVLGAMCAVAIPLPAKNSRKNSLAAAFLVKHAPLHLRQGLCILPCTYAYTHTSMSICTHKRIHVCVKIGFMHRRYLKLYVQTRIDKDSHSCLRTRKRKQKHAHAHVHTKFIRTYPHPHP